jgi:tRNA (guanine-N7-)-methyltransferase
MERRLPQQQVVLEEGGVLDPANLFSPARPRLWLEIGFGGGEHLATLAAAHPDVGLIGCEPYVNGVARLLSLTEGSENLRIVIDDARLLLDALPENCLERIFVLFPDPWPKLRHHKRRIVNPTTARAFERLLIHGGELRLATDHPGYARAMLAVLLQRPGLEWRAERPDDWRMRTDDWPPTRYEQRAIAAGRQPVFLRFRRLAAHRQMNEKPLRAGTKALI